MWHDQKQTTGYWIPLENAHRAESDVIATIELFKQMLQKFMVGDMRQFRQWDQD